MSQSSGTDHPLSNFVSYSNMSYSHHAFISLLSTISDPTSYTQAIKHPHWRETITNELHALEKNKTWILSPLPHKKNLLVVNGFLKQN